MPTRPPWPPANELLSLAVAHLEAAIPRLVLVGGLPGTGKSTIARRIGDAYRCPVLRSDVVRKLMADLDPQTPAPAPYASGLYRAEVSARTYAGLLEEAAQLLGRGHSVVVDASWSDRSWRQAALDLGDRSGSVVVQLRCQAPPQVAAHRIAARAARGGDPSDATVEVAEVMALNADPWQQAVIIDTSTDIDSSLRQGLAAVEGSEARTVVSPTVPGHGRCPGLLSRWDPWTARPAGPRRRLPPTAVPCRAWRAGGTRSF